MARAMEITTPLGRDVLLFHSIVVNEALGNLPDYRITVLSERTDIDPNKLVGRNVTVRIELADGSARYFDTVVTRFAFAGVVGRYVRYEILGRSWLWFLTRAADCRIFQNMNIPDIIKEIFSKYGIAVYEMDRLTGSYDPWEYCVQYRETDFNFVSRLMEQEGIYYYFTHQDGKHTLILADSPGAHEPFPGYKEIPFVPGERARRLEQERLTDWRFSCEVQPGAYVIDDYDFQKPSVELLQQTQRERAFAEAGHEIYDYPGEFDTAAEGDNYVRIRLEELQAQVQIMEAAGNARGVATGHFFTLSGQPREDQNRKYLITSTSLHFGYAGYEANEQQGASYHCSLACIPADEQYRPPRATRKPIVQGLQTAVVVGPAGEEIFTDNYGRVKVHFHWDRHGAPDENASCWMRVSHPWAGKNFGMIAIPRIGQEVVVEFLEGDPNRPLITGRVYNAEQMPPWELPANKAQTGVLTRSSKEGTPANANAIRFEDLKGSEQLWIHAEKNQDIEVENDETHWVGHDRSKTVDNDETITIHNNRTERVDVNEVISIGVNRTETVGGNESIAIAGNRTISVGKSETASVAMQRTHVVGANESIAIGGAQEVAIGAYMTVNVGANVSMNVGGNEARNVSGGRNSAVGKDEMLSVGKTLVIEAGDSVTIKTGSASISMKKDGTIVIKGKDITLQASGKINAKASGNVVMKGSKILQN